jgi:energy-converting hydrogenase B subunit D
MTVLIAVVLGLVALGGTATVLTTDPVRQAPVLSMFGLLLGVLFMVLQAPDVALSQIAVGSAIVPLIVMLAIRRIRRPP